MTRHRTGRRRALAIAAAGLLAACAGRREALRPADDTADTAAAADWPNAETVLVVLDEYSYTPARIALRAGRPYRLRLESRGGRGHDFVAPAFFAAAALRPGDPATAEALTNGGALDVAAREAKEVFLVPLRPGAYPVDCTKPLHDVFGMTGEVQVEA